MATATKHVLFAGLGRHVSAAHEVGVRLGTNKTNRQMVLDEVDKARAAGYECSSIDVNPEQPEESLNQIKKFLTDRHQDLFIVGFGLRGNAALTPLFEKVVNACVELSPKTRLGFAPAPNEMYDTIMRVLAEK